MRALWRYSFFLFFTFHLMPVLAEEQQIGLLWKIEKSDVAASYLFGTIHSEDKRVTNLPKAVKQAFEQADSVSTEISLDLENMLKVTLAMMFQGEEKLSDFLDKSYYEKTVTALKAYGLPELAVRKLKPWTVILTLSMPKSETGKALDMILYEKAVKAKKAVYGLETIEEQLAVFEDLSMAEQIKLLKETVDKLDENAALFENMHRIYLQKNLTELMTFSQQHMQKTDNPKLMDKFIEGILYKRNLRMLERMQARLQEGNAFVAVGALHLPGKQGLLHLLKEQGYRISAVY